MTIRKYLAASLVATTVLGGAAFAAEHAAHSPVAQEAAAQRAVDRDVGKFSKDGALAFRDLHLARVAIFDAQPAQAKELIGKAKVELAKAKADDAVFNRAEADLSEKADLKAKKGEKAAARKDSPGSEKIAWLPIDAQLTLDEDFQATPAKSAAVAEANKNLVKGDKKAALEKLKLADIDVNFVMAVLPLEKTTADVDRAATLIDEGKYYEANAVLKTAEDRMRFDIVDTVGVPNKAAAATTDAKNASQQASSTTQDTKKAN